MFYVLCTDTGVGCVYRTLPLRVYLFTVLLSSVFFCSQLTWLCISGRLVSGCDVDM